MANHIQLPNELFEALTTYRIPPRELRIVGLIIRLSSGCQKEFAVVHPMIRFEAAGLHQPDIRPALEKLVERNVIYADFTVGAYAINPDVDLWVYERTKFDPVKYAKLIGFNLAKYSETLYKYSETLYRSIVKHYTDVEQNTISEYSKTLYTSGDEHNNDAALSLSKDNKERQLLNTTTKGVVSQQGGNGKSQSFLNFARYEMNGGRGTAIRLQMKHGLPPDDDLLTYWQENGYKELLDFYNGNTAG